jgi:hypothetical protein
LSTKPEDIVPFNNMNISEMFDFKYKEDVEECYSLLITKPLTDSLALSEIRIKDRDEMIDLSPCIGIYQEAVYFKGYDIDKSLELYFTVHPQEKNLYESQIKVSSLDQKILLLTSLETRQRRYRLQVDVPFVKKSEKNLLIKRLGTKLDKNEDVQVSAEITFSDEDRKANFKAIGLADAVKGDTVYELKFVTELTHEHFLQCASYMVALDLPKGILWNTRNNAMFEIAIPDRKRFLNAVAKAITKGKWDKYYK